MRETLLKAQSYRRQWQSYERELKIWEDKQATEKPPKAPGIDLEMETLKGVLEGQIFVHTHCYRADDISAFMDMAADFNFKVRSFHHGLEAYKVRDRLAKENVSVSTWADWWGFKMEAYDGIPQNIALLEHAGVKAIVHSDSADDIRRLNQEAQKAATAGAKKGMHFSEDVILRWVTYNPAWALGIESLTGTLEPGKYADIVVWNGNPFSVYTKAEKVFILGHLIFEHDKPPRVSDFELGHSPYQQESIKP
jgi:imidazolonepropionase-like amidohydrolase